MVWVIAIAALLAFLFFGFPGRRNSASSSDSTKGASAGAHSPSAERASTDEKVPARLRGIHPDPASFWSTEEFFVRLGEACAAITDRKLTCSMDLRPNGDFTVLITFASTAGRFFPALFDDIASWFSGTDPQLTSASCTWQQIRDAVSDDAPTALVETDDGWDRKSVIIVWNPSGMP